MLQLLEGQNMAISNMNSNLKYRAKKKNLKETNCLFPLFEAIVNSIQSIEERPKPHKGRIEIFSKREMGETLEGEPLENEAFESFYIKDNGVGFNKNNYKSFKDLDSSYKEEKGCKGVGRILWLVAFNKILIESNYINETNGWEKRNFEFNENGTDPNDEVMESNEQKFETCVKLIDFKKKYQSSCPRDIEILSRKIVDHCLLFFLDPGCPEIIIEDNFGKRIVLNDFFKTEIKPTLNKSEINLKGEKFSLYHTRKYKDANKHELRFCANQRDVTGNDLSKHILNLQKRIKPQTEDSSFYYVGYLIGNFLDSNVDSDRVSILFSEEEEMQTQTNLNDFSAGSETGHKFTRAELINSTIKHIESYLSEYLEEIDESKKSFITDYIYFKKPQYRYLISNKPGIFNSIPAGLTEDELELKLHDELIKWEKETHEKGERVKKNIKNNVTKTEQVQKAFLDYCKSITDINKTSLAEYVIRRKAVLDLLENSLELDENGNYKSEENIHSIICPLRYTSDEIEFEEMNLWIIDERLAYHNFLASDKQLKSLPIIDSESSDRPDIAIFNQALSFTEGDVKTKLKLDSVTVIEFKRPNRDGLNKDQTNPIDQVLDYVKKIRTGAEKRWNGRPMGDVSNIPFYCYIIADLTESMKDAAENGGLQETPDKEGYFGYNSMKKAYIEVISYSKLLEDSIKRNQILFDKLFTPRVDQIFDNADIGEQK